MKRGGGNTVKHTGLVFEEGLGRGHGRCPHERCLVVGEHRWRVEWRHCHRQRRLQLHDP